MAPRGPRAKGFRGFVQVTSDEAASRKAPTPPQELTEVAISHLELSVTQHEIIRERYAAQDIFSQAYSTKVDADQVVAASVLAAERLDIDARESMANKWYVKWVGKGSHGAHRVLYQW